MDSCPFALAFIVHTFCLARAHGTINSQRQHTHTHARKHARIIIIIMCSFLYHFSFGVQGPLHEIKYRYPCTQSAGEGGGLKIVCHCAPVSLLINIFGIHLEPGCKSHEQIIYYRTAKNVPKQATVLLYFLTISHQLTRKGFPVVWPVLVLRTLTTRR